MKILKIACLMLAVTAFSFNSFAQEGKDMKKIVQTAGRDSLGDFAPEFAQEVWQDDVPAENAKEKHQQSIMFPIGAPNDAYAQYFVGQSYLAPVSTEQVKIFNVTFEPKCRNNWHIHHAKTGGGQMLIGVGGRGYYQEWGKEPVDIKEGDVIHIPANVKHWHGAAPDSWFSHLAIEIDGEETSNEWLEKVSDEEYGKLK